MKLVALFSLSAVTYLTGFINPIKSKQLRFFYHASQNMLPQFKVDFPLASRVTIEQALIHAATNDAVGVLQFVLEEDAESKLEAQANYHLRRLVELAAEFGAAKSLFYLLHYREWSESDLDRIRQWGAQSDDPLIEMILDQARPIGSQPIESLWNNVDKGRPVVKKPIERTSEDTDPETRTSQPSTEPHF